MNTGQYISGVAHIGLIGWALFGGVFAPAPEPFEVTEVAMISTAEFEALIASDQPPEATAEAPAPVLPEIDPDLPDPPRPSAEPPPPERPQPAEVTPPEPENTPDVSEMTPPSPPAELSEDAAVLVAPSDLPDTAGPISPERPKPRPAPRVAPEPVAPPEPDQVVDDIAQDSAVSDATGEEAREKQDETVEQEAATEIVTEAEEAPSTAPSRSLRPKSRPARPAPQPEPEPATDTDTQAAVDDLLAGLVDDAAPSEVAQPSRPAGPPMTATERDALRVSVQKCWNTGALSSDALRTIVVVGVAMTPEGKPDTGSIRLIEARGGTPGSAEQAFQTARRAIIRCGSKGFDLPREKYEQWRDIEMTFNPEKMRIK